MDESLSRLAGGNPGVPDPDTSPSSADDDGVNQSDATRLEILDAVVRCFAAQGWAGTNMSLVARETGMTRGKIQYYFPVLEDLKYAAIERLHERSRGSYFEQIDHDASPRESFDRGIDLIWEMTRDPLSIAMIEVAAAARTDGELRQRLTRIRAADEEARDRQSSATFPAFAAIGQDELHLGRLFTTVFVNGLAAHSFPDNQTLWQARLIDMLKECLIDFWTRRGVTGLNEADPQGPGLTRQTVTPLQTDNVLAQRRRDEALALLQRAATLLGEG